MNAVAGRRDLDATIRIPTLRAGEPVFLLRGQDQLAAAAVRAWAALAHAAGVDPAVIEQALQQAERLEAWEGRKLPDADHLADAERKQLAWQFSRRAWHAREDVADVRIALAEERTLQAVIGRLRPILDLLFAGFHRRADGSVEWVAPRSAYPDAKAPADPFAALADLRASLEPSKETTP